MLKAPEAGSANAGTGALLLLDAPLSRPLSLSPHVPGPASFGPPVQGQENDEPVHSHKALEASPAQGNSAWDLSVSGRGVWDRGPSPGPTEALTLTVT